LGGRGDRRAGAQAGHVGGQRGGLVLGHQRVLALRLRGVVGHRHPAGGDLEVHGGGPHAHERGSEVGALCVQAVAGGAVGPEQFLTCGYLVLVAHLCVCGLGGGDCCVGHPRQDEGQEQHDHRREPVSSAGGE